MVEDRFYQGILIGLQKIDLDILFLRGVFIKIGTIIRVKSNILRMRSI